MLHAMIKCNVLISCYRWRTPNTNKKKLFVKVALVLDPVVHNNDISKAGINVVLNNEHTLSDAQSRSFEIVSEGQGQVAKFTVRNTVKPHTLSLSTGFHRRFISFQMPVTKHNKLNPIQQDNWKVQKAKKYESMALPVGEAQGMSTVSSVRETKY